MFEFDFVDIADGDDPPFSFRGATTDFLELISQAAKCYSPAVAGNLVTALLEKHKGELDYLRLTPLEIEYQIPETGQIIKIEKRL